MLLPLRTRRLRRGQVAWHALLIAALLVSIVPGLQVQSSRAAAPFVEAGLLTPGADTLSLIVTAADAQAAAQAGTWRAVCG